MGDWIYEHQGIAMSGILVLIIVVLTVSCFGLCATADYVTCNRLQTLNPDYVFHWDVITFCRVQVDGFWVSADDVYHVLLNER